MKRYLLVFVFFLFCVQAQAQLCSKLDPCDPSRDGDGRKIVCCYENGGPTPNRYDIEGSCCLESRCLKLSGETTYSCKPKPPANDPDPEPPSEDPDPKPSPSPSKPPVNDPPEKCELICPDGYKEYWDLEKDQLWCYQCQGGYGCKNNDNCTLGSCMQYEENDQKKTCCALTAKPVCKPATDPEPEPDPEKDCDCPKFGGEDPFPETKLQSSMDTEVSKDKVCWYPVIEFSGKRKCKTDSDCMTAKGQRPCLAPDPNDKYTKYCYEPQVLKNCCKWCDKGDHVPSKDGPGTCITPGEATGNSCGLFKECPNGEICVKNKYCHKKLTSPAKNCSSGKEAWKCEDDGCPLLLETYKDKDGTLLGCYQCREKNSGPYGGKEKIKCKTKAECNQGIEDCLNGCCATLLKPGEDFLCVDSPKPPTHTRY